MAATAVYASITSVPGDGGTVSETKAFSNISATTASFPLKGGKYMLACIASTYGTVTLQALGPDGSTYLTAATAFSVNGTETADLAQGQYRFAVA
jgi:hypothetical protein